jgi:hypothetical protein
MLYDLAIDSSVESQDKKEKNEIALYDFIKNMLAKISPVIGNVNNFDILTDSKNNAQIVDINLVSKDSPEKMYENAFPLQLHNLNSTVRSYKLESKIFPEQSTQVAIGAQVEGGALGTDTTTFVAFNRSIRDRIIPVKSSPPDKLAESNTAKEKLDALLSNLETLYLFFGRLKPGIFTDADFDVDKAGNYQNALKDLINYLRSITTSKTSNKAILPTVLSIVMDGIGGLIIGNLFKTRGLSEDTVNNLYRDKFDPFFPSQGIIDRFSEISRTTGQPNPFIEAEGTLRSMERDFSRQNLDKRFTPQIQNYIPSLSEDVQPLNTSMPNASILTPPVQQFAGLQNGLTPTENALLSPEEQRIRLRQRGLA